ncbi:hypothetical protein ACFP2F_09170 [Hymenobacter artigasi]|uniref:Lipoprotein n=1 Tax=Hymenobacter artigasi TaxID=2719616 RepID=A0ABX1HHK6_9BACT|nr:hypothetical protein [Hymenobacter artigasi]NKI89697.1 hypothetical protein [Hymenobacter artigasi]
MIKIFKKFALYFLLVCLSNGFFSCTNIYYVGQTSEPTKLYAASDTATTLTYTVPVGSRVLSRKKSKKYHYIIFETYTGYAYNPVLGNYHKYNSAIDGNLYGYSSTKSTSTYNSSSSSSKSSGGPVHVKGYTRKNGTYVQPHTRSAPRRR